MVFRINLSLRDLKIALMGIVLVNLFFLLGTWFAHSSFMPVHSPIIHFFLQLDLGAENNMAAWYSSMLLFLSAIMSLLCFAIDLKYITMINRYTNFGWLVFALIFSILSFDELGSVHEYIGDSLLFKNAGEIIYGNATSGWLIFMVLTGVVSVMMVAFTLIRIKTNTWAVFFLLAGLLFYLSNPLQENFEVASHLAATNPLTWKRPILFLILEEGSEIFGSLCFIIAITLYATSAIKLPGKNSSGLKIELPPFQVFRFTSLFIISSTLGLFLTEFTFGNVIANAQVGVPKNWFTAMLSFVVFLYSFNALKNITVEHRYFKVIFVITAMLGLAFSVYFGSNLYAYPINSSSGAAFSRDIIIGLFCLFALVPVLLFFILNKSTEVRVGAFLWSLICVAMFSTPSLSAEIAFDAFCCLFYTLTVCPAILRELVPATPIEIPVTS